jgi:hypothetical protein
MFFELDELTVSGFLVLDKVKMMSRDSIDDTDVDVVNCSVSPSVLLAVVMIDF